MNKYVSISLSLLILVQAVQIGICSGGAYDGDNTNKYNANKWGSDARNLARVGDIVYGQKTDADLGHVGIVINTDRGLQIREAMPSGGVQTTPFEKWFAHWNWIALLRPTDNPEIARRAAEYAANANGAYTFNYASCTDWCDDYRWYCSELVWKAYKSAGVTLAQPISVYVTPATVYNSLRNQHVSQWYWNWGGWHVDKEYDTINDAAGTLWAAMATVGAESVGGQPCCTCADYYHSISNCPS
jgi:hypothetical protein